MRILVAEDDRITRASLARQLVRWGHDVVGAEDGEQAWERFSSAGPFDLILTDWEMPRLSGVELVRRVRAAPGAAFVYVILLTGRGEKADLVRGIEAGADDFVTKPFDREELRVRLLSGERVVRLERSLSARNAELTAAGRRMREDLEAAARVQRAMLPQRPVVTPRVRTAWTYVPTEELAGDAIGLHLVDDRYLVCYVVDVAGHGVPAALLAVTAMHQLAPAAGAVSLLCEPAGAAGGSGIGGGGGGGGGMRPPARVAAEVNRRFSASQNDDRFLTMVLCVLDTHTGRLAFTCAGHPLPVILRGGESVPLPPVGGLPLGIDGDAEYDDAALDLRPGDRVHLFSDGIAEQYGPTAAEQFGTARLVGTFAALRDRTPEDAARGVVDVLTRWASPAAFKDDVSLLIIEWLGPGT